MAGVRVEGPTLPPAAPSEEHARPLLLLWWPCTAPRLMLPFPALGSLLTAPPATLRPCP